MKIMYNIMYNMNGLDISNEHIEQGIDFTNIKKNTKNDFTLLDKAFLPNLEPNLEKNYTIIEGFSPPIDAEFNKLLSEYTILNDTYNAELTSTSKTVTPDQLNAKYTDLINEANSLKTNLNTLGTQNTTMTNNINSNIAELNETLNQLNQIQSPLDQMSRQTMNANTINGKIETTSLNMTSTFYYYIVYFFVCVTIIAMTFNLLLNPDADVMKSVYVVGGILAIYFISKYIVN